MKIFEGQGKVREFLKKSGNSLILSKSVKSQGICCQMSCVQDPAKSGKRLKIKKKISLACEKS